MAGMIVNVGRAIRQRFFAARPPVSIKVPDQVAADIFGVGCGTGIVIGSGCTMFTSQYIRAQTTDEENSSPSTSIGSQQMC